jgi:hypothetical protein
MTADRLRLAVRASSQEGAEPAGRLVVIDGSAFPHSPCGRLAATLVELGPGTALVELARLDAGALLGRRQHRTVTAAIDAVATADGLVLVTPVYRRSYSGVLKAFLDLLPPEVLDGVDCLVVATGTRADVPAGFAASVGDAVDSLGGHLAAAPLYLPVDRIDVEGDLDAGVREQLSATLVARRR